MAPATSLEDCKYFPASLASIVNLSELNSHVFPSSIPLLPYILVASVRDALFLSIGVTGIVLLIFGVVKQKLTGGQSDFKGLLYGAFSTLFVGAAAAGSSWIIVRALEGGSGSTI